MADQPKTLEDRLYPAERSMELAMDHAFQQNANKLRDAGGLTEEQTAEMKKQHTQLLTGMITSGDALKVHEVLTQSITSKPVTQVDSDQQKRDIEAQRVLVNTLGRERYGWRWDKVSEKARGLLSAKPELVKLLEQNGAQHNPVFWMALAKRASHLVDLELLKK